MHYLKDLKEIFLQIFNQPNRILYEKRLANFIYNEIEILEDWKSGKIKQNSDEYKYITGMKEYGEEDVVSCAIGTLNKLMKPIRDHFKEYEHATKDKKKNQPFKTEANLNLAMEFCNNFHKIADFKGKKVIMNDIALQMSELKHSPSKIENYRKRFNEFINVNAVQEAISICVFKTNSKRDLDTLEMVTETINESFKDKNHHKNKNKQIIEALQEGSSGMMKINDPNFLFFFQGTIYDSFKGEDVLEPFKSKHIYPSYEEQLHFKKNKEDWEKFKLERQKRRNELKESKK
jgi:hypothetical protein